MTTAKSEVNTWPEVGFNMEGTRTAVGRVSVEARVGGGSSEPADRGGGWAGGPGDTPREGL